MKKVLVALAVLSCSQPRPSSVNPAPLPAPTPGVAVYDGNATIDPQAGTVDARWHIAFVPSDSAADTLRLRLNRGFTVTGQTTTRDGDEQLVAIPPGASTFDVSYTGVLAAPGDSINRISPDWIELGLDSFWQPVFARFDKAIIGRLRLTLPNGYRIAASGRVTRISDGVYQIDAGVPLLDFPFSASRALTADTLGGTRVYFTGSKPGLADAVLRTSEACSAYLNALYGRPDSLPPRTMVLAPRTGPGYARKNYIVITNVDTTPVGLSRFVCHELAHFWSIRANSRGPDNWLNEGFAEFISAQYVRSKISAGAYDTIVTQWRTVGERQPAVWTPDATRRPSAMISYRKAPYLLTQLEARIGAERMQRVLTRYMTESIRTTPELLGVIGAVSDSATADWFRGLLALDQSLEFPLMVELDQVRRGNPLAQYARLLELKDRYRAHPMFSGIYDEVLFMNEEFLGVPDAGVRALHDVRQLYHVFPAGETPIPAGYAPRNAVDVIAERAARTQIVIWGEEHHLPQTRSLYEPLLRRLWRLGYRYLAAETFEDSVMTPGFRVPTANSGVYTRDPVYAQAVRVAVDLGYKLIAYEERERGPSGDDSFRDRRQAEHLKALVFDRDSAAKVLVLAGRGHASESVASDGWTPMASVLKRITGIDPLTIYAVRMSERLTPEEEEPQYRFATARGLVRAPTIFVQRSTGKTLGSDSVFDAYVFWPRSTIVGGRPDWMITVLGRTRTPIPAELTGGTGLRLVQARRVGEAVTAIPVDQVVLSGDGSPPDLMLPSGEYTVRTIDRTGRVLAEKTIRVR